MATNPTRLTPGGNFATWVRIRLSSVICGGALVAIFFNADVYVINGLRALFAVGLTFLLITSEYLVTARCDESNRGRLVGWYTTALGAGAITGPLLVTMTGIDQASPFLFGATLLLFGAVGLSSCLFDHEGQSSRRSSPLSAIAFMPAAFLAAFVFGIADNGGLSMLPVYGALNGYDNASAANLAVFAALGATLLQLPIGWLATKRSTTELLVTLAVLIPCLLALFPIAIHSQLSAWLLAACFGGLVEGLYTIGLVTISRDRRVRNLPIVNACFISVCSVGEVVGPTASGVSMHFFGPDGLVAALIIAFALYALAMVNRLRSQSQLRITFD